MDNPLNRHEKAQRRERQEQAGERILAVCLGVETYNDEA